MKLLTLIFFLILSSGLFSQSAREYCGFGKSNTSESGLAELDVLPEFKGTSDSNLISVEIGKYIARKMYYRFKTYRSSGVVCISYIVNEKGRIENIDILKGANEELDKIAYRLIKKMPRWKPGIKDGKAVKVKYNIPLNFKQPKPD